MRILKFAIISVVVFFFMLTALSLVFPSNVRLSRTINVGVPKGKVLAALNDLHTWPEWNRFVSATPLTGKTFSDPSSGQGAFLRSDQLLLTITAAGADSVRASWTKPGGRSLQNGFDIWPAPGSDSLTVQEWFDFHFRWYPWEKFQGLIYDRQLGPLMEESLAGLKRYVENSH